MPEETIKYKAFISYSHADERWARWLQRSLERYRVPARLRQAQPDLPRRLYPVFRDRDELASGDDLGHAVRAALAVSDALLVICSPAAAASPWVNQEISYFRELKDDPRIFCLMVAGSPQRDAPDCAFPEALLQDEEGCALPEPLAADASPEGDGRRDALIKIAAGLLGVGVDDLKQRDAQRRARLWAGLAAGSMAVAVLTVGLAVFAMMERAEADLRRTQAENLIGFMLGDLREKLEPVDRLDVLDAVGDEAMAYFASLEHGGTQAEVRARAMALRQIGEVRFQQAQLDPALEAFIQSRNVAAALWSEYPDNNDYLYELSQAEFWVGYVAWERDQLEQAAAALDQYLQHSQRLLQRSPNNADYQMEMMYAYSNLGSVAREAGKPDAALSHFDASLGIARAFTQTQPELAGHWTTLAGVLSWRGSTLIDLGQLDLAQQAFGSAINAQHQAFALAKRPADRRALAELRLNLSGVLLHQGQVQQALSELDRALADYQILVAHDPDNGRWHREFARTHLRLAETWLVRENAARTDADLAIARKIHTQQVHRDPSHTDYQWDLVTVERVQAQSYWQQGARARAIELGRETMERATGLLAADGKKTHQLEAAMVAEALGRYLHTHGAAQEARSVWNFGIDLLPSESECDLLQAAVRSELATHLGKKEEGQRLAARLQAAGFADLRYRHMQVR